MWALWETAVCAVFHGVHTLRDRASFVRRGTDLSERGMSPSLVIKHFDVIEQLHLRVPVALEVLAELALDRREEALHDGIVPTVAAPAHAADDAARLEDIVIVLARVVVQPWSE